MWVVLVSVALGGGNEIGEAFGLQRRAVGAVLMVMLYMMGQTVLWTVMRDRHCVEWILLLW